MHFNSIQFRMPGEKEEMGKKNMLFVLSVINWHDLSQNKLGHEFHKLSISDLIPTPSEYFPHIQVSHPKNVSKDRRGKASATLCKEKIYKSTEIKKKKKLLRGKNSG